MIAAVLFARSDSVYKSIDGLDVFDISRDARNYAGTLPAICHPPCRAWGRLRHLAKPRFDEKQLAIFAVKHIQKFGGILEHPAYSTLWNDQNLPVPGSIDVFGGWTLPIQQHDFGHRAQKNTWLYIVGVSPYDLPIPPMVLGEASHVIAQNSATRKKRYKPPVTMAEREHTPIELAAWLVKLVKLVDMSKVARYGN